MIIQELLTRLGFTVNTTQLNAYNAQVAGAAKAAVGVGAGIATALMGTFIKLSADTFGKFEAELNQTAAVSGATREELAKLEEQALNLGSSTKFSATETATAQGELSKAGMSVNQVLSATPGILSLAAAGGLAVGKAAEIASGSINAFGLEASRAGDVADLFAMGANVSAISVEDLGETAKYAAPAFRGAGQSIEDFTALTAIMGNNMIKGSMAGTSLAGGMSRLVSPPSEAAKALKKYNIQTHDAKGNMLNIVDILIQMKAKLKGATQQQKSAALTQIFGMEAAKGFNAVLNTSDKEIRRVQDSMHNTTGAAKQMADVMNSGLLPTIDEMKGAFETLLIKIGKELSPYLITLANILGNVANAISNLSPWVHTLIAALSILTFIVGASITAILGYQMVLPALRLVKAAFMAMNIQALLIPAVIAIGIAAMALFINDLITFANGGTSLIGRFLAPFPNIKKMLLSIIDNVKMMYGIVVAAFQNLGLALQQAFGGSGDIIEYLMYAMLGVGGVLTALVAAFVLGSATILLALGYIVAFIPTLIAGIWSGISAVIGFFAYLGSSVMILLDAMGLTITSLGSKLLQVFVSALTAVGAFFVTTFTQTIPLVFTQLYEIVSQKISSIKDLFATMINDVVSFFSNAFLNVIPGFISNIGSSIANIASRITGLGQMSISPNLSNTPGIGGAGGGTSNQYHTSTTVHVGGSNASPSQIAGAAAGGTGQGLKRALGNTAQNYKGAVR